MTADTAAPAATVATRALSPVERWYWIADQVSPLNVIARVRATGDLPADLLRSALDRLQQRHPLLRVAITTGPGGRDPVFTPRPAQIPLRRVEATAEDAWVREIDDHELAERIDWRAGPLCRAVVVSGPATGVPRHDLVLTLPHCIADGTTVMSLAKEWLTIAADLHDRPADAGAPPRSEPALPAGEQLFPPRYRGLGAVRLQWQLVLDWLRIRRYRPARFTPRAFVPFERRRTRLIHRSLSGEQVEALLAACRRERTTVHGALAAAMVTAVGGEASTAPSHVTIGSPIDFRADLVPPVPGHAVGAYVATVPTFVAYQPDGGLWAMARQISADLAARRRRSSHLAMVSLVGLSCPPSAQASGRFIKMVEKTGPVNTCLSNIGRYDFPDRIGPWLVEGAQFIAGLSVCGYFVSTVNTSHGRLFWNFVHIQDALPAEAAERLVDTCVDTVLAAMATRPVGSR